MDVNGDGRLDRTVRLYPWYALVFNAYFWMPVFVLYFLERLSLGEVLRLEAIYYACVVVLEVPSGYFSDRVGRRPTLLIAGAGLVAAYVTFALGTTFTAYAVAQALLAVGIAFNSGTDTSLHYDALASIGRTDEYAAREARAARNALLASGGAALVGGAVGMVDLRLAYALSALAALVALGLVVAMAEPHRHERLLLGDGPLAQARACGRLLGDPVLRWTFAFAVVMTVLNHVPYEFYQPYLRRTLPESLRAGTPLMTGLHAGVVMVIASIAAARSIAIRDRLGYTGALLAGAAIQVLVIGAMALLVHPVVLLVVLLRSVPRGLAAAPVNAAVAPRVASNRRATFISFQSLVGRLAFAGFLVVLSAVGGADDGATSMGRKLLVSAGAGAAAWIVLWAARPRRAL